MKRFSELTSDYDTALTSVPVSVRAVKGVWFNFS